MAESWPLSIKVCEAGPTDPRAWDQAVESSRDTWLYHLHDVAVLDFWSIWAQPLFVECWSADRLLGGALLTHATEDWRGLPLGLRMARTFVGPHLTAPFVVDGVPGPVATSVRQLLIDELLRSARRLKCDELWLCDSPQSRSTLERETSVNALVLDRRWSNDQRHHFVADLRVGDEACFAAMKSRARRHVRAALADGAEVKLGSELEGAELHFVSLMSHHEEVRSLTPAKLKAIWSTIYAGARHGEAFFVFEGGEPTVFLGVNVFGNAASYQLSSRSPKASSHVVSLAMWEGMRWSAVRGCEWFDVGRAIQYKGDTQQEEKEFAISWFKESFSGKAIPVDVAIRKYMRPVRGHLRDMAFAESDVIRERIRKVTRRGPKAK